jgi:peptidyl-prolyl cis-trans isomerase SurA
MNPAERFIKILLFTVLLAAAGAMRSSAASEVVDRIVAVVNDDAISLYELNQMVRPYIEQIRSSQYPLEVEQKLSFDVRSKILNQMIDQKLTDQELQKYNITVTESEVDKYIERMKSYNSLTDEMLQKSLRQQEISFDEYRGQIRKQLLRIKLVNREVRSKIVITREEVEAYYEAHKEEYAGEKKFHLQNIYVRLPSSAGSFQQEQVQQMMASIHADLKSGQPPQAAVAAHADASPPPESSDLGMFKLDELAPQLQEKISTMQAGDFTPVLRADFGYQIVYVAAVDEIPGKSLEEAAAEIENKLYNSVVDTKYNSWLQALRDRSHIKIIN